MKLVLATHTMGQSYEWVESVDSTNSDLMRRADSLPDGHLLIAEHQTAGKGRLGRRWQDRKGASLCLSLLLRPQQPFSDPGVLPLVFGLGCAEGLRAATGVEIGLKWPNDLVLHVAKLAGLLCESRPCESGMAYVCGIGVNLGQTAQDFEDLPHAISLAMAGVSASPLSLAAAMVESFESVYDRWREDGFAAILDDYSALCVTLGKPVRILREADSFEGTATSVLPDGQLLVRTAAGDYPVRSGEVSVRGLYGYL